MTRSKSQDKVVEPTPELKVVNSAQDDFMKSVSKEKD